MRQTLEKMRNQLNEFFGRLSTKQKLRLGILSGLVVVLAIVAVAILARTTFVLLHVAQNPAEAGEITAHLEEIGANHRVNGLRIYVPEAREHQLRNHLALEGVGLAAFQVDMSILEAAAGFGVTDDHRTRIYEIFAANQIVAALRRLDAINDAMVIVNLGDQSPFHRPGSVRRASASVTLNVHNPPLTPQEATAVGEVVRAGVTGIALEDITIVDQFLNLYRLGEDEAITPGADVEARMMYENRLAQEINAQIYNLVRPIYGIGVRVETNIVVEWDVIAEEAIEFAPPIAGQLTGIVRSISDLHERSRRIGAAMGPVGTDVNEMGTGLPEYPWTDGDEFDYERRLVERNYEINQRITTIARAQGYIRDMSISVVLDDTIFEEDFTEEIRYIVTGLVTHPAARIAVTSLPFIAEHEAREAARLIMEEIAARERFEQMLELFLRWGIILALGITALLLLYSIFKKPPPVPEEELLLAGGAIDYLVGEDGEILYDEDGNPILDMGATDEDLIELRKKSNALEQIEKFIERNSYDVAMLLRNWLAEE